MFETTDSTKLLSIADFPRETINNQFVLLEHKGTDKERVLGAYNTGFDVYKIYKDVSHKDKIIIKANVIYPKILNLKCIYGYEEIKD